MEPQQKQPAQWQIRELLWRECRGCRFVGIQEGLTPERSVVIFNTPTCVGPVRSLALFISEFSDFDNAVSKVHARLNEARA